MIMDAGNIVFATGGYDHSIKFWYPHDGVCYRTAQHPESVRAITKHYFFFIFFIAHHMYLVTKYSITFNCCYLCYYSK